MWIVDLVGLNIRFVVGDLIWLNFGITDGYVLGGIVEFIVEDILDYEAINNGGK